MRILDRILVFDQGWIIEDGDHDALLANPDGRYRRLFDRQPGNTVNDTPRSRRRNFEQARPPISPKGIFVSIHRTQSGRSGRPKRILHS